MFRLAYIVTHPIQYQAPLLRLLACSGTIDLKVFFLSDFSLYTHVEESFGQSFKWDVPLSEGYSWEVVRRWIMGPSTPLRPYWPVRGLKESLRAGKFDAVWIHGWGHIGLLQALFAASSLGIPVLLRGESLPIPASDRSLRVRLRNYLCRKRFSRVAAFLPIGSLNREFYRGFGIPEEKLFPVPYAVNNPWFSEECRNASLRRETFRQELGLEPGRKIFLFAAKFIPVKAPGDLLAAFLRVLDQTREPKPYLLFVGNGPLRSDLEKQAGAALGKDVHFLGFRNQTALPAFYDLCDVFVLPSQFEPWGLVVNELMNASRPAILSDRVGCAPDLLKSGHNGWIFPCGDITALSNCLSEALERPDLRAMGQKSAEIIRNWDFRADLQGLLEALRFVTKR